MPQAGVRGQLCRKRECERVPAGACLLESAGERGVWSRGVYSRLAPSLPREEHMHPLVDVLVVAASHGEHACPRAIAGCLLMLADLGRSR